MTPQLQASAAAHDADLRNLALLILHGLRAGFGRDERSQIVDLFVELGFDDSDDGDRSLLYRIARGR